ncbi:MAG: dUTP diphosphatase [Lachnospiraceae bacterium]|nr:dUTP diphosphatase [Lachnospiraceae bacterium]
MMSKTFHGFGTGVAFESTQEPLRVKIKKLCPDAIIPSYAKDGDAGLDLTATSRHFDNNGNLVYGTGLAFEIPKGYVGLIFPRSSLSKYGLALTNCVGVVDSGYRGEVTAKFKPQFRFDKTDEVSYNEKFYRIGDRIAQMIIMPYPQIDFVEVDELSDTERGRGGYGSTGV